MMLKSFSSTLGGLWSIRHSSTSGNKSVQLLLWSLLFGTAPVLENSCYLRWMPMYQYFLSQNISRAAAPLFLIPTLHWHTHTRRGETWSSYLGMLYSGLWTSCVSSLTSSLVSLHPNKNTQGLGHSEFGLIWPGDLVILSYNFQSGNCPILKTSDTLCSE